MAKKNKVNGERRLKFAAGKLELSRGKWTRGKRMVEKMSGT